MSEGNDPSPSADVKLTELPLETPEWGLKLVEIIQTEFRSVNTSIAIVEDSTKSNLTNISAMEKRLNDIEEQNKMLENENGELKERLLDLEY